MEERMRDDGFEATFVVSVDRDTAWDRLQSAKPAVDGIGSAREGQWWIPGIEAPADELEVDPGRSLRARKALEPCKGTEIVVTLEDEGTGTRITIMQTGFGKGFSEQRAWLAAGWYPILADIVVYFERGVSPGRHALWWSSIGCDVVETPEGLVVGLVRGSGFAADAGLEPGDLILQLAGSPILTIRDLAVLTRGPVRSGDSITVRYLRGVDDCVGRGEVA